MLPGKRRILAFVALCLATVTGLAADEPGRLALTSDTSGEFRFHGIVGQRTERNRDAWLLTCPQANPGLTEMFQLRDRQPVPQLVPWAGEFVGKYLISAVQALRMQEDPRLQATVAQVVQEVIRSQADDGYLGPFRREERLLGHWDLWGHYHVMLGLLDWHDRTDDPQAMNCCLRAADLVCATYNEAGRSTLAAGSHEMNMAVIHVLGRLYRITGNERYLKQMRQIEHDWDQSGDYFRTGVNGTPFYRTPRPRWESLHDLQGLVELYRITGDEKYKQAYLHHWRSIRDWDRRNSGGFSSGEQATGNPYEATAIETCCTIAWMALSVDALALSADSTVADELELSTFNAMLGAQHPSGRWWTYSTPMDGRREASAHSIVFQARAGTPELNCCSVNAPRGLGMLSEWGVMQTDSGLAVNFYGPGRTETHLRNGTPVTIDQETEYPWQGLVKLKIELERPSDFTLALRIPEWSTTTRASVNNEPLTPVAGQYLNVKRKWTSGDVVTLEFDMALRYESGDLQAHEQVSIYRGPILLAYDQTLNEFDAQDVPKLSNLDEQLKQAEVSVTDQATASLTSPWLVVSLKDGDRQLRLCDFASAGAAGTTYRSWLPASHIRPAKPVLDEPVAGAALPSGRLMFSWRRSAPADAKGKKYTLVVAGSDDFAKPVLEFSDTSGERAVVPASLTSKLTPGEDYYWKVVAQNEFGTVTSAVRKFRIDTKLSPFDDDHFSRYGEGADGILVSADLEKNATPSYGHLENERQVSAVESGGLAFDGRASRLIYRFKRFPERDYTLVIGCRLPAEVDGKLQQIASAWCAPGDDPLRLCLDGGKLYVRAETSRGSPSSQAVEIPTEKWVQIAVVKSGPKLMLYVDGQQRASVDTPAEVYSSARDLGLGANPHHTGDEYFRGALRGLKFYAVALTPDEIAKLAKAGDN